jgi:hypothetical protein
VVIEMVHAEGWLVAHNTALLLHPAPDLTWGMEARFADSQGTFAYNLTNMRIWADRDGAQGSLLGNVTSAQANWFAGAAAGDLHLAGTAAAAIDRATTLAEVSDDIDGDVRPIGAAPDVGADEYGVPAPEGVTDLHVTDAVTDTDTITFILRWTPPAHAVTATLRYSQALIDETSWGAASLLGTAPGSDGRLAAAVPYREGTFYFALKSQNAGGAWSDLSNNAFWPHHDVFLPLASRHGP